jgi:SAM-dependent methyltransferase
MSSEEALGALIDLVPTHRDQDWIEVACGPGLIARALAPRVRSVLGLDLTPAMLELARAEAERAGVANVQFAPGDATKLDLPDASVDTRFSLHHIPVPGRCLAEMARVVRPGGYVALGDGVSADDVEATLWHQEVERLRDPSHWLNLTIPHIHQLGERAGLALVEERTARLKLDWDDWLARGSGGAVNRAAIEAALAERPEGSPAFQLERDGSGKTWLRTRYHISLWRRP